jgi:plastocyanin domain-containing protein
VVVAKPGIPLEITFKPGPGCLGAVLIPPFSIKQDIRSGAVVKVPAMQRGEYPFSCGMKMVFGKIVVR